MPLEKQSLNNFLPDGFETNNLEGYKENFSADKIATGYEKDVKDRVSGPNFNNLLDVLGKNTNTLNSYVEYLNNLSVNKTPIIDSNNQLNSTQIGLKVYSDAETYLLNDLVTTIQDGKVLFYKSLVASNTGNPLTNTDYWEKVKLGGGGFEICDIGMALYVDETKGLRRYLNGQVVDINTNTQAFLDRLKEITTLHPSLLCTEEEWQTAKTMSAFGQVGKFVFNYSGNEIVSVRLPRAVNVQGLFDLQNLGMTVSAGLPNITGSLKPGNGASKEWGMYSYDGSLYITSGAEMGNQSGSGNTGAIIKFDASRSNPIYGKSNTVQPEAIQYPYFIQIATGSETENNIINDIELNNPFSLFDSKYSDHELNNLSWLKSSGQWNAKAVYPTAYDKLLKVKNGTETVGGLSVKLSTETYTDYDFVLNTADETFRLPLLNGSESIVDYSNAQNLGASATFIVPYNGYIRNIVANTSDVHSCTVNDIPVIEHCSNSSIYNDADIIFVKKGDVFKSYFTQDTSIFYKAIGNGSLYFYVGETVQNANLIDAGRIGEQLVNKLDRSAVKAYITETYVNGTSGYIIWSNGYCEQWGIWASPAGTTALTFMKTFADTNYQVFCGIQATGMTGAYYSPGIENNVAKTTTGCTIGWRNAGTVYWRVCGYLAEGEY